jgi:hypothetical protein
MSHLLLKILSWAEVWSLLMPIIILLKHRSQPDYLKPIRIYVWIAFGLNLAADIIAEFKRNLHFPDLLQSNNLIYNIHSIVRFTCFCAFFIALNQPFFTRIKKLLPILSLIFIAVNFTFFESFFKPNQLSGTLLTVEAYLLLIYCILYYLYQLKSEKKSSKREKHFWVATGLSIYVVINFFIFLFYDSMIHSDPYLARDMWRVHNIAYIVLSFFLAKAFYAAT